MKTGLNSAAFTIVEVLIVLAVSGALLIAGLTSIAGQQNRTQFNQAAQDIQAQINDVMNNVATGYYAVTQNFSCTDGGSGPALSSVGAGRGTNGACIFIGRAVQFTNDQTYNLYDIAGLREKTVGVTKQAITTIDEASPTAIAPTTGNASLPNSIEALTLLYGLTPVKISYSDTASGKSGPIGSFAFFSLGNKSQYDRGGSLTSGVQELHVIPIEGTSLGSSSPATADAINAINGTSPIDPDGGIKICFKSGGTKQFMVLTIGSNNRQLSTDKTIYDTPPAGVCT